MFMLMVIHLGKCFPTELKDTSAVQCTASETFHIGLQLRDFQMCPNGRYITLEILIFVKVLEEKDIVIRHKLYCSCLSQGMKMMMLQARKQNSLAMLFQHLTSRSYMHLVSPKLA